MSSWVEWLVLHTWWRYDPNDRSLYSILYRSFNLIEGIAWLIFAGLVLARYLRNRKSTLELWYAAAFVLFGLTDFREAYAQQSWLIAVKLVILICLLKLRSVVMRRYYPDAKVY